MVTPSPDRGRSNTLNVTLTLAAAVADWIAITAFLAKALTKDPLLILLMVVAAIVVAVVVYAVRRRVRLVPVAIVFVVSVLLATIAWSWLASSGVTPLRVNITDPPDGGNVTMQYFVKGTVADPDARVYVVVHPLRVSEMWVQKPPIVDRSGNWQTQATFGGDALGIGESYEVIALATNDNFVATWATGNSLSEGRKLTSLPRKSNRSNRVTVIRPK